MGFLDRYRARKHHLHVGSQLYLTAVDQSRTPALYTDYGVPDTVDGRFDMIIVHIMLLIRRLRGGGEGAEAISQNVLNLMFADMDRNFREMGIADISIGKHVKRTAKAFYGRAEVLEKGLDAGRPALLDAVQETIYPAIKETDQGASELTDYIVAVDTHLRTQSVDEILTGNVSYPSPTAAVTH